MSTSKPGDTLILRPDVVVTTLEHEAVLLDLETKYFYSVNHSGWAITQLFETGATRELAQERIAEWGAGSNDLDAAYLFIDRLFSERLIAPGESQGPGPEVTFEGSWSRPTIEKHKQPLHQVMVSAFDPTLPLAE